MQCLLMHKFREGVFCLWNNFTEKNENFAIWPTFGGHLSRAGDDVSGSQIIGRGHPQESFAIARKSVSCRLHVRKQCLGSTDSMTMTSGGLSDSTTDRKRCNGWKTGRR
jgi:hypothetical protein